MSVSGVLRPLLGRRSRALHISALSCTGRVIDGRSVANLVLREVKADVDALLESGATRRPRLVAVLVGDHAASKIYVANKLKAAKSVGIDSHTVCLDTKVTRDDLLKRIKSLNEDDTVDGLLVQLPLPEHLNQSLICEAVASCKDVDGFHSENIGKLALNSGTIIPATALAVKELIVRSNIPTFGKNAVVIGRSKHVGLPIALLLHSSRKGEIPGLDMTTTICHRHTPLKELQVYTRIADIVVTSAGLPGLITKDMIKPGACVIDVGITRVPTDNGKFKLVGDVDYEQVKQVAGHITPVPGGVGPMTVAMLMKNTVLVAKLREKSALKQTKVFSVV